VNLQPVHFVGVSVNVM